MLVYYLLSVQYLFVNTSYRTKLIEVDLYLRQHVAQCAGKLLKHVKIVQYSTVVP